jgi:hypothetical protein
VRELVDAQSERDAQHEREQPSEGSESQP